MFSVFAVTNFSSIFIFSEFLVLAQIFSDYYLRYFIHLSKNQDYIYYFCLLGLTFFCFDRTIENSYCYFCCEQFWFNIFILFTLLLITTQDFCLLCSDQNQFILHDLGLSGVIFDIFSVRRCLLYFMYEQLIPSSVVCRFCSLLEISEAFLEIIFVVHRLQLSVFFSMSFFQLHAGEADVTTGLRYALYTSVFILVKVIDFLN